MRTEHHHECPARTGGDDCVCPLLFQIDGFRETVGIQRERIAELEREVLEQSMRIATATDV